MGPNTANCLNNIQKEPPPHNRACTAKGCQKVMAGLRAHCEGKKLADGTPVICYDEDIDGPGKGGICYCCCSCFTYGTLIEKTPGNFVPAQEVKKGEYILAAGPNLQWAPRLVTFDAGFLTSGKIDFVHTLRVEYPEEPARFREVTVTADHLFMRSDGKLIAVQSINAGDQLRRADGKEARVIFRVNGTYEGGIHTIELGTFDNNDLNGHLLNCFGLVSTDYSVQAAYAHGDQAVSALLATDAEIGSQTTAQVRASGDSDVIAAFLADLAQWPQGFVPAGGVIVNVPRNASSFFTASQAETLLAGLEFNRPDNLVASNMTTYLFDVASAFYRDITFILDWGNDLPNAYSFQLREQDFVVVNGGLARIKSLNRDGMALILGNLIAHTLDDYCVGEADYYGVAEVMRLMWDSNLYATTWQAAVAQLTEVFEALPDYGLKVNTCDQPSTSCRLSAYKAGFMLAPVPECAHGNQDTFQLIQAVPTDDLDAVTLYFTEPVEQITGGRRTNYQLTGRVRVATATVEGTDARAVLLGVRGLTPDTEYIVTVRNVVSATGHPISGDANKATFTTGQATGVDQEG